MGRRLGFIISGLENVFRPFNLKETPPSHGWDEILQAIGKTLRKFHEKGWILGKGLVLGPLSLRRFWHREGKVLLFDLGGARKQGSITAPKFRALQMEDLISILDELREDELRRARASSPQRMERRLVQVPLNPTRPSAFGSLETAFLKGYLGRLPSKTFLSDLDHFLKAHEDRKRPGASLPTVQGHLEELNSAIAQLLQNA